MLGIRLRLFGHLFIVAVVATATGALTHHNTEKENQWPEFSHSHNAALGRRRNASARTACKPIAAPFMRCSGASMKGV